MLNLDKFIIGGHSNGGDIAKYFANNYPERISHILAFDARRCPINIGNILMFEANDTSTDFGVIPNEGDEDNLQRHKLEWVIIKPKNALHESYMDRYITDDIKKEVINALDWFLKR